MQAYYYTVHWNIAVTPCLVWGGALPQQLINLRHHYHSQVCSSFNTHTHPQHSINIYNDMIY